MSVKTLLQRAATIILDEWPNNADEHPQIRTAREIESLLPDINENGGKRHNGWTNYETWLVKLWMDNDEAGQNHFREFTAEVAAIPNDSEVLTDEQYTRYKLAERLKDEFESGNPLAEDANMWSDLLNAALSEVNWREIADALLEAHKEHAAS